jgi:hypothetical protein
MINVPWAPAFCHTTRLYTRYRELQSVVYCIVHIVFKIYFITTSYNSFLLIRLNSEPCDRCEFEIRAMGSRRRRQGIDGYTVCR